MDPGSAVSAESAIGAARFKTRFLVRLTVFAFEINIPRSPFRIRVRSGRAGQLETRRRDHFHAFGHYDSVKPHVRTRGRQVNHRQQDLQRASPQVFVQVLLRLPLFDIQDHVLIWLSAFMQSDADSVVSINNPTINPNPLNTAGDTLPVNAALTSPLAILGLKNLTSSSNRDFPFDH
jgi:hypothetical protein